MLNIRYNNLLLLFSAFLTPFSPDLELYSHVRDNQQLVFFGSIHSHNPTDPLYEKMENAFTTFLQNSTNTKKILLHEGTPQPLGFNATGKEIIRNEGDRGFAHFLAKRSNIENLNADINRNIAVKMLLEEYSLETVHAWATDRFTLMWKRFAPNKRPHASCNDYINYHLSRWFKDIDLTNLKNIDVSSCEIEEINFTYLAIRQKYTFGVIQNYWDNGYDIFIVFGNAHAKAHKQNIKALLK